MSVRLGDLALPADWRERYGRKDGWHGDTHSAAGVPIPEAQGKPRVQFVRWFPAALAPDDLVEELHITYTDGEVVKVPAEEIRSDR